VEGGHAFTRLLLVRHGESTWNARGIWQGQADPPLSALGERQAAAAAAALTHRVVAIHTSDLARARRTAELLAVGLALPSEAVRVDARLRERDAAAWSGLTRAEIEERWPGWLAARRTPPGWETDDALVTRTVAALRDLVADPPEGDGIVVVVTHGGNVRVFERQLGAGPEPLPNLAGRWVVAENERFALGERQLLIDPDDIEVTVPPPR
jgi:broad specificity phosphatase PhoE